MLLITGLGATREKRFPKAPWMEDHSIWPPKCGSLLTRGRKGQQPQSETNRSRRRQAHTLLHTSGFAGCAGGGGGNPWVPSSCVPLSGGLCRKQLRVLEGGIHHARLTVTRRREPRRKNQSPAPGLAPQTSRCTKKAQSLLSPFSGQSTGRGGLPRSPESWWLRRGRSILPARPISAFSLCLL